MKAARVYWQHVILWTGGLVAVSLVVHFIPGYFSAWLGLRHFPTPYTAALFERIATGIAIASLPAGMAASKYVISWSDQAGAPLKFTLPLLVASVLVLLFAGFLAPRAALTEESNPTPRLSGYGNFYSFDELLSESARFRREAHIGAKASDKEHYNPTARYRAEGLKERFFFIIAWTLTPLFLGWIGVLIRLWSSVTQPQARALAEWVAALALLLGIQATTAGWFGWYLARYGGSPLYGAGDGRSIVFLPALVLLALAWTTAVARKHFRPLAG